MSGILGGCFSDDDPEPVATASAAATATAAVTVSPTRRNVTGRVDGGGAVPPPGTGSVTLSWLPPMQYTDGAPLDIGGYRVYAGPSWDNLALVEDVPQPGISSYMLSGLSSGTWFFALTVYDALGVESAFSNIGSKTF